MLYVFGDIELDERVFELRRAGEVVHVQPKVLDLLFLLAKAGDRVVLREEIQRRLWRDVNVGDASITRAVVEARRAIGDDDQEMIVTVRGRGFRMAVPVVRERAAPQRPEPDADEAGARGAPWVGRGVCLSAAAIALERARGKSGSLLWISGERGIGKSRALAEIGRQAEKNGATVRMAHAHYGVDLPPYWLWKEALPELDAAFPQLSIETTPVGPARFSLFDGIARHIAEVSTRNPLVFLFDDLHWADQESLQLLEFLAPRLASGDAASPRPACKYMARFASGEGEDR
jgi:DNA-binding winged helix-turn-helix (wHTH) protein